MRFAMFTLVFVYVPKRRRLQPRGNKIAFKESLLN